MHLLQLVDNSLLVAELLPHDDPLMIRLGSTGVVRWWGTSRGRGELALDGPTRETIVDREPSGGEVCRLHVVRCIPCSARACTRWRKALAEGNP
jgi:hypothetical protein